MSNQNTQAPITKGQQAQLIRIIQDALPDTKWIEELLAHLKLDKNSAQMIIESGNALHEVRKFLADKVKKLSDSTLTKRGTKSASNSRSRYREARGVDEQIEILSHYDWGREVDWRLNEAQQQLLSGPTPKGSEGYFAVVFDETMITHYGERPSIDQSDPVNLALNALSQQFEGRLANYCKGKLGSHYYRRNKWSAEKMRELWESQLRPTGIILIPAQLGIRYRGKSVSHARGMFRRSEFPLDAYEVIQMVLTRENHDNTNKLCLDLPGGEYLSDADGVRNDVLSLWFINNGVCLYNRDTEDVVKCYGSVSGFLLK